MTLDKYFMAHKIIGIGCGNTDIIVDNPFDFVDDIASMQYYITEILWWERIEVCNSSKSIGHGGPRDPRDKSFYFSETDLCKKFSCESSSQIKDYLNSVYLEYSQVCLYPSFSIKKKQK